MSRHFKFNSYTSNKFGWKDHKTGQGDDNNDHGGFSWGGFSWGGFNWGGINWGGFHWGGCDPEDTCDPSQAINDSGTTDENSIFVISGTELLANDIPGETTEGGWGHHFWGHHGGGTTTPLTPTITAVDASSASGASVSFDGTDVSYDPGDIWQHLINGETATDTFTYTIDDGCGDTSTATVTVTIEGRNDGVIAVDDATTTDESTPATITAATMLSNDADLDGDTVSITSADATTANGYAVAFDGATYTVSYGSDFLGLGAGETATDSFTYTVIDAQGETDTATVNITINGLNQPVVALDDTAATQGSTPVVLTVADLLANDADPDETDVLSVASVDPTSGAGATVSFDGGDVTYDPGTLFDGLCEGETATDTFTYTALSTDGTSDTATVTVTITGTNAAPTITAVRTVLATEDDTTVAADVLATDPNIGDVLTYTLSGTDADDFTIDGTTGEITFASAPDYEAPTDSDGDNSYDISVTATDQCGASDTAEITVNVADTVETPPTDVVITEIMANPSAVSDSAGEWFEIFNTTGNDIDINGWTIQDADNDSHTINNGGPLILAAGGYLVLGNNADTASNGGVTVDYQYSGFILANSADEVILSNNAGGIEDSVFYDGSFPLASGASMEVIDPAADNDDAANWQAATTSFGDGDLGSPGSGDFGGGGGALDIRINEVHYDDQGADDGEFVEIRVEAGGDISGYSVELVNGNGATTYNSLNVADMVMTSDGSYDYYVWSPSSIQNGAPDGIALIDGEGTTLEFLSYEGSMVGAVGEVYEGLTSTDIGAYEDSTTVEGTSLQANDLGTWSSDLQTAGSENFTGEPLSQFLLISEVQGTGMESLYNGVSNITVEAVVTYTEGSGFWLQEEDGDTDGDDSTSEGIFVYTGGAYTVAVGQIVEVTGTVTEYFGLTEITSVSDVVLISTTTTMPTATTITLSPDIAQDLEAVEGMMVSVTSGTTDPLTVTQNYSLAQYGEIAVSAGTPVQPTQILDPQDDAAAVAAMIEGNANNSLIIEDGNSSQNPDAFEFIPNTGPGDNGNGYLDAGDTFDETSPALSLGTILTAPIEGVMTYSYGDYQVIATSQLEIDQASNVAAIEAAPANVGGGLQVASVNVLNYFTTLDTSGNTTGPNGDLDPRGATSAADLAAQTEGLVAEIIGTGAEVIAVQEIENGGFGAGSAPEALVAALNAEATLLGTGASYAYVDPTGTEGFVGTDAIMAGVLYDASAVTLLHSDFIDYTEASGAVTNALASSLAALIGTSFAEYDRNRPSVAATFEDGDGNVFTVVSSHFKSKGDSGLQDVYDDAASYLSANSASLTAAEITAITDAMEALLADPNFDQGDGQGFWSEVRNDAAGELEAWVSETYGLDGTGVTNVIYLGDLNSYAQEDSMETLTDEGLTDLIDAFIGQDEAYSYVFDGQQGTLDQALADATMADLITGATEWHINADQPSLLNYSTAYGQDAGWNAEGPIAASDHDPLIIGIDFSLVA